MGKGYAVKNLLEFKHAQRVLVEDNILENSWSDAQIGYAINVQSGGDSGPLGTVLTSDVTFRWNIVRNAPLGFLLAANPYQSSLPVTRVAIENNLFENIGPVVPNDNGSRVFQTLDNVSNLTISHNTAIRSNPSSGGAVFIVGSDAGVPQASNVTIIDNLAGGNTPYGAAFGSGGYVGTLALNQWAGSSWAFHHNVLWDDNVAPPEPRATPNNSYPGTQADVGLAADWSLLPSSPYKGRASDGSDPGVNIATLKARTATTVVTP